MVKCYKELVSDFDVDFDHSGNQINTGNNNKYKSFNHSSSDNKNKSNKRMI